MRAMRIEAGMTQAELGRRARVHNSHVSRIESGQRTYPAPQISKALAEALGCPLTALITIELLADKQ